MAEPVQTEDRQKEFATDPKVREKLLDVYKDVEKGFEDQFERSDKQKDYWDIYNCKLGSNQFYAGTSRIFDPIVRNAIEARVTRFTNQIFPVSGRHVEVTTEDATLPHALMALLEHYVKMAGTRTYVPALLRNGDIEGQYNLYVNWVRNERHTAYRSNAIMSIEVGGETVEIDDPTEDEDITEETIMHQHPTMEVLADADVVVLPATADSIDEALSVGGSATILRRWSKSKIKSMIDKGEIDEEAGEDLLAEMTKDTSKGIRQDPSKDHVDAAGIKGDGRGKWALVYETWTKVKIDDEWRICKVFFAGADKVLSCRRNPMWSDKIPLISAPVRKIQGAFKGQSLVQPVADLQYLANDMTNVSADSAIFGMLPVIMTNPEKNPKIASMVLALGAVWETNPNDTQPFKFPDLWKNGGEIVANIQAKIFQALSVNPASITQGSKRKSSQAEMANEQQVDILSTADAVTIIEHGILTPMLERWIELDHQYRDEVVTVQAYGAMGLQAAMQKIEPIQMQRRYQFRWFGVEAARNVQQVQQQIAALNVIRGIPPQLYEGYKLDVAPFLVQLAENAFGPRLAPQIFKDLRSELSVDPKKETDMLIIGLAMPVHPLDDHQKHMQVHLEAMQSTGDPHGTIREHLIEHQMALAKAAQAQVEAMQPKGAQGVPGGAGAGVAGSPRVGAQPMAPRGAQQPPGAIPQDQMHIGMPRRM